MFECIKNIHTSESPMTIAVFVDGDVGGSVSFHPSEGRSAIHSDLGPIGSVRMCELSHWRSIFNDQYRARTTDAVHDYSQPVVA